MKRRSLVLSLSLGALALSGACDEPVVPVDPVWGKQPCAACGMLVSDRRYAAQALPSAGARVFFDDPGCMVGWLDERKAPPRGIWVREEKGERWLDARAARYARGARTPMDFGFAARADEGVPYEAFAAEVRARSKGAPAPSGGPR